MILNAKREIKAFILGKQIFLEVYYKVTHHYTVKLIFCHIYSLADEVILKELEVCLISASE